MDMTNNNYFNNFVADYTKLTPTNINKKYNSCINIAEHQEDDDVTVCASNITSNRDDGTASTANSTDDESMASNAHANGATTKRNSSIIKEGVLDTGATGAFLQMGAPVVNLKIAETPLRITLPNGDVIKSTHTCNLDIPWLPDHITEAHIVPGLSHTSLVSARKFCDAGCKITFDKDECRIFYKKKLVLSGKRDDKTGLWTVPLNPSAPPSMTVEKYDLQISEHNKKHMPAMANNVYTIPHKQNAVKYMHQCFFSPPIATLLKAIENGQLDGIPHMKSETIRKHLAPSPATAKGRMKRPRQGIRSTRNKRTINNEQDTQNDNAYDDEDDHITPGLNLIPDDDNSINHIHCFAALADKQEGTFYTDCTGALPVRSLDGNQYFFVAYDYDTNTITSVPIAGLTDGIIIEAFDKVFTMLKEKGHTPKLTISDNQAVKPLKEYLKRQDCEWQFVEPRNHRVNAAERAIQTFKNHYISGLCTTDRDFPLQLWDNLNEQAMTTLNLLRTSRKNPTMSGYESLHNKKYDWNRFPMAPPGTKAVIYESPEDRTSWGLRGIDAWYCGTSPDHYRNC